MKDLRLMMALSHDHVVRLIGVSLKSEPWRMITEVHHVNLLFLAGYADL
jgi:hypothetical protein